MISNYKTIYLNLPTKIKGFCAYNACEDFYTIILNARLSYAQNIKTFFHELEHIKNNDFYSELTAEKIEALAH